MLWGDVGPKAVNAAVTTTSIKGTSLLCWLSLTGFAESTIDDSSNSGLPGCSVLLDVVFNSGLPGVAESSYRIADPSVAACCKLPPAAFGSATTAVKISVHLIVPKLPVYPNVDS